MAFGPCPVPGTDECTKVRPRRHAVRFVESLAQPGFGAIAEFKRRSPSAGDLRPAGDVREVARAYERAGARAMSVLVDERFAGTWDDLRAARAATSIPLLAKGFFSTRGPPAHGPRGRGGRRAPAAARPRRRDLRRADARGGATRARHARRGARRRRARAGDGARRAGDRRECPRPLDLRDRPARPARARSRRRRATGS